VKTQTYITLLFCFAPLVQADPFSDDYRRQQLEKQKEEQLRNQQALQQLEWKQQELERRQRWAEIDQARKEEKQRMDDALAGLQKPLNPQQHEDARPGPVVNPPAGPAVAKPMVTLEQVQLWVTEAEQGDSNAQTNLGYCYATGKGVLRNDILAYKWLWLAHSSNPQAANWLEQVRQRMTFAQIEQAMKLARFPQKQ